MSGLQDRTVPSQNSARAREYWRANLRLIAVLLAVWAAVSLILGILLVMPLNGWRLGNLPFGFWLAQQGSIYVFVLLIFLYAWRTDRLDRKYGVSEGSSCRC